MSDEWNSDMSAAPRDRWLLVFGQPEDIDGLKFTQPGVHLAAWDQIDQAFCLKGGTWLGPFIEPTHWKSEPAPPTALGDQP